MKKAEITNYPKISIITCVYNGEKYISKLLDSVLNMGYPNIEHIIINDGSIDTTEEIVMNYAELYKNKEGSKLYIKYIKQDNMGLGGATNAGLKDITGEYWTWINCDDWYEKEAFFEPIEMLLKKPKLDYVQMNGWYNYGNRKESIVKAKHQLAFKNKYKLFSQYLYGRKFKWILYICRTSSFLNINPNMVIYPSRYTQDDQLISQIFGLLNGDFCSEPSWNFYQRPDSYQRQINPFLLCEMPTLRKESVNLLNVSSRIKLSLIGEIDDAIYLDEFKSFVVNGDIRNSLYSYRLIIRNRKNINIIYKKHLCYKMPLYLLYCFVIFIIRIIKPHNN